LPHGKVFATHLRLDVRDDLSPEGLSLIVVELKNALWNQDKLLCKIFRENKRLNLKLESASSKIASLRSVHDDMSAKPRDNCTMIMVNNADLWCNPIPIQIGCWVCEM
jgi:hypothetical protein